MKDKKLAVISIIVAVAAVVLLLLAFFGGGGPRTAAVTLPSAAPGGVSGGDGAADVTPSTVQAVLKTLSRPDSYSRTLTAEDHWVDGGVSTSVLRVWVSGGSTRITLDHGGRTEDILVTSQGVWIWYDGSSGVYHGESVNSTTADRWMRAVTYESLLALDPSEITGAGYGKYAGDSCVWAEYTTPELGYTERAYVSVSTGLLMGVETYDGGTLVYKLTSGTPSLTAPDAGLFTPPQN